MSLPLEMLVFAPSPAVIAEDERLGVFEATLQRCGKAVLFFFLHCAHRDSARLPLSLQLQSFLVRVLCPLAAHAVSKPTSTACALAWLYRNDHS